MALSAARGARWEHGSRESRRLKVAILVDDGFELVEPRKALDEAGVQICHGPRHRGRGGGGTADRSWPSLETDIRNAGAEWVAQEVVVDGNLVTSRKPDDIPAFNRATIDLFAHSPGGKTIEKADVSAGRSSRKPLRTSP